MAKPALVDGGFKKQRKHTIFFRLSQCKMIIHSNGRIDPFFQLGN